MNSSTSCYIDKDTQASYLVLQHFIFGTSIPVNCLGLYLIYSDKTTRIKWILFNCQLCFFLFDVIISSLVTPLMLLPVPGYYSLGVLANLRVPTVVQLVLAVFSIGIMVASTVHLFFHRHQTLLSSNHPRKLGKYTRPLATVAIYLFFSTAFIPEYLIVCPDRQKCLADFAQAYPCLPPETFDEKTLLFSTDYLLFIVFYANIYVSVWISSIVSFVYDSFKAIAPQNSKLSPQTAEQLRRSLRTVVFQISVYFLFIMIPTFIMAYVVLFKTDIQILPLLCMAGLSFHSTLGTVVGICLNQKYRRKLFEMIQGKNIRMSTLSTLEGRWASRNATGQATE